MSDDIFILPRPVQAGDAGAWAVLREACRRIDPVLVIIDTQARVTVGLEENSAKEMGVYIEAVRSVREATGACVLSVHHTGRQGGDARGSSAIDGAQTTELKVESRGLDGTLLSEKQKDLQLAAPMKLRFEVHSVGVDEDGIEITSLALAAPANAFEEAAGVPDVEEWVASSLSVVQMVIRVLTDHGAARGITKPEAFGTIVERFFGGDRKRLNKSTWHTAWNRALEAEGVIPVGGGRFTFDPLQPSE